MSATDIVRAESREQMEALGFVARSPDRFTRDIGQGLVGCVSLSHVVKKGLDLQVDPTLGVGHAAVERMLDQLRGRRPRPFPTGVIGRNVGYFTRSRSYRHWDVPDHDRRARREVRAMVRTIATHARPFFAAYPTLEAVLDGLRTGGFGTNQTNVTVVPVCLAVLGRDDDADAEVRAALAALGDADHGYARELRAFAGRFLSRARPTVTGS